MSDSSQPTQADYDFAVRKFGDGLTAEAVEVQLVDRGLTADAAKEVVVDLMAQMIRQEASQMLQDGLLPMQVEKHLRERGFSAEAAQTIVANAQAHPMHANYSETVPAGGGNVIVMGLGAIIFVIGVFLFIGNVTGMFPTVPCAGWLGMVIGGGIWGAGKKGG
ncbi:MAG TPA: hypothetical protein VHR66_20905 [Gemmataceae bacterium]|jgi:hypothetical protein|nr:hypothetical protein [Gemmataceae bacterium]